MRFVPGPSRLRPRFEQQGLAKPPEVDGGIPLSACRAPPVGRRARRGTGRPEDRRKRLQGRCPRLSGSSPLSCSDPHFRAAASAPSSARPGRPPACLHCPLVTPHALASPSCKFPRRHAHRFLLCSCLWELSAVAIPVLGPLHLLGSMLAKAVGLSRGHPVPRGHTEPPPVLAEQPSTPSFCPQNTGVFRMCAGNAASGPGVSHSRVLPRRRGFVTLSPSSLAPQRFVSLPGVEFPRRDGHAPP